MADKQSFAMESQPAGPNYVWLEKTRCAFTDFADQSDTSYLHGILAEGQARLKNIPVDDPLLGTYIQLTLAEAHFRLALESDESADIQKNILKGKRLCEKAGKESIAAGSGIAAQILPRAVTLLSSIYHALPEVSQPDTAKSLEKLATALDHSLLEQRVLRESALELRQGAHLFLSDLDTLNENDRHSLLVSAADQMLRAGERYLQAGDTRNVTAVKAELEAIQASLLDPQLPAPELALYEEPVQSDDLLPEISSLQPEDVETVSDREKSVSAEDGGFTPATRRKSALRWVFSIAGMLVSCLATLFSGFNLISGFIAGTTEISEVEAIQTQNAAALTQMAVSGGQASSSQEISPMETQLPVLTQLAATAQVNAAESPSGAPAAGAGLTGSQAVTDFSLFDDFSSPALGWPTLDDGRTVIRYEDGGYTIQVKEPDAFELSYWPVNFIPYEASFDVQGPQGDQDGTLGVFCHLQNRSNYYYVEMDLQTREYVIMQVREGELIPLTAKNESGNNWQRSNLFRIPATSVNHIGVSCYLDSISLYINDQLAETVSVPQPFDLPGLGAFVVYAHDFAGEEGYKVFFDNVEIYQPVQ